MPTLLSPSERATPTASRAASLPLWVAVGTLAVFFLRFGYVYGAGDQDELIPSVLHLLDSGLFTRDWIVQTVTGGLNVRSYFLGLVWLPSLVLPVWLATGLLWIGVIVALAYGIHALARALGADRVGAALGVLLALAVTVRFTVGHNALAYNDLVPEGVAWTLAVPGLALFLRGRYAWAGALLGVATWFHLLAGLHGALVLGGAVLLHLGPRRALPVLVRFGGVFLVAALPMAIPVAWSLVAERADPDSVSPFYVHAFFRNPHHHLWIPVAWGAWLRFGVVLAVGVASAWWLSRRGLLPHRRLLAAAGLVVVALMVIGFVSVHVAPWSFGMKLQVQKLTVLVTLVATLLTASALSRLLPDRLRALGESVLDRKRLGLIVAGTLAVLVVLLAVADVGRPGALLYPVRHAESPLGEAERWAREHTPRDALFAIPPSVSTFRTGARRSVTANFNAFVFTDAALQTWFERLMDVAPLDELPPHGHGIRPAIDAAYHAQDAGALVDLRQRHGTDYALRAREAPTLPFPVVFENRDWRIVALSPEHAP